jgi:hypothetical protein
MEMTEDEIVWRYKKSGCSSKMITVLAQLNATNRETIRDILDDHGVLVKKGLVSKKDMDKMTRKTISKEDVEEIKALARGEEPEEKIIPNAVKETLEQEIASINVYISKLQAKRDVLEEYLGWHKVDEDIEERLKEQQS